MTKKEREEERKLREELKIRRENGDTAWYIRRGKLFRKNF